jgi:hypothetical protein
VGLSCPHHTERAIPSQFLELLRPPLQRPLTAFAGPGLERAEKWLQQACAYQACAYIAHTALHRVRYLPVLILGVDAAQWMLRNG